VGPAELAVLNEQVDAHNPKRGVVGGLEPEEAAALLEDPDDPAGKELQQGFGDGVNILGAHPCFDALINHPGYISHVKDFVNGEQTAFTAGGSVMQRWPGQASGIHGGGDRLPDWFAWDEEQDSFLCRAVNVVVALNDCGEHGGNTAVVPGSHKSNLQNPFQDDAEGHPQVLWYSAHNQPRRHGKFVREGGYMDGVPGAVEVTMEAGDALIFIDSLV